MTSTKKTVETYGTLTVELEEGRDEDGLPVYHITSNKNKTKYRIRKSFDGFAHYFIETVSSNPPKDLNGRFTSTRLAKNTLVAYLKKAPMSAAAKYENNRKDK